MIIDSQLQLSSAQVVTTTAVSTNTIDLAQARDVGAGENLEVSISVDLAALAAGAATVTFQVITSAAANLSSPTIIAQTDAVPKASLTTGARLFVKIPAQTLSALGQRYLGLQYTIGTGPLTQGTFTANVIMSNGHQDVQKSYPSGFAVS